MRCAKFGQGTNSYFIWMPVWAVKSFDSSTSALAGSQAAQHSVSCLVWACAAPEAKPSAASSAAPRVDRLFKHFICSSPVSVTGGVAADERHGLAQCCRLPAIGATTGLDRRIECNK